MIEDERGRSSSGDGVHRVTPGWLRARLRRLVEPDPLESSRPRLFHRAAAVGPAKDAASAVIVEDRAGLVLIDRDSARDHARGVVGALHETIAAMGACAIERQLLKYDVECAVTSNAHASPRESLHQHVRRDVEEECDSNPAATLGKLDIECASLGQRTWKAVQQHAAGGVGPGEALDHHLNDQLVRHELALIHVGVGGKPEWCAAMPVLAKQIAGCDVGDAERLADVASLGTLAGAGRADQQRHRESSCDHLSPCVAQVSADEPRDASSVPLGRATGQGQSSPFRWDKRAEATIASLLASQ